MSMTWPIHGSSLSSRELALSSEAAGLPGRKWTSRIALIVAVVILATVGTFGSAYAAGSIPHNAPKQAVLDQRDVEIIPAAGEKAGDGGEDGDSGSDGAESPEDVHVGRAKAGGPEKAGARSAETGGQEKADAGPAAAERPDKADAGPATAVGKADAGPATAVGKADAGPAAAERLELEKAAAGLPKAQGWGKAAVAFREAQKHDRPRARRATCNPPTNIICQENNLPGNPASEWDVPGAGDSNIQGYATQISVNAGETVQFKVDTAATSYRMDIYRIGYYGGMGARKMATVNPSVPLPQTQPACLTDATVGLVDCGNWALSASWDVPATAVSGVYIGKLVRTDGTAGASQVIFVVRNDARQSDLLFKTSDAAWQAYNTYGGNSLYLGNPVGRAYKVSYNRPFTTNGASCCQGSKESWFFSAEYPMVRWLEANGYDVSYFSSIDTASRGSLLLNHKVFLSVGHDEYWSGDMRTNVENARDNGVNLAFFSGNEVFWKTRWEPSIDGASTPFRTLVCYKETLANQKIDPSPQWTGTWRDPRFTPPSDGGRPENALTGTLFMMNGSVHNAITVPAEFAPMRIWRNTSVANLQPGQVATFPTNTLGYEWDVVPDNGVEPPGSVRYSRTTIANSTQVLLDFGSSYGAGVLTHSLVLYRASSGALVFGAGTVQWSWGLDANHTDPGTPTDINMQQATVNLLADMRSQPSSLQSGLVPATASTDTAPPTSAITSPLNASSVTNMSVVTVQGTAADTGGGVVAGIEISFDGTRWYQATGTTNWTYQWQPPNNSGPVTIRVRAVDDIGNLQATPTTITVNVVLDCPCTIWTSTTVPGAVNSNDQRSVELGVKFRVTSAGYIRSIRFYKGTLNSGTHTGSLWTSTGQLLASAVFTSESASGWQQVDFPVPVPVDINTTYVASYFAPNGRYAYDFGYFTTGVVNGPLVALANGVDGGNGVYRYGATSGFPTSSTQSANYWVDVVFTPSNTLWENTATPAVAAHPGTSPVNVGAKWQATTTGEIRGIRFYKGAFNTGTHIGSLWTTGGQLLASATFTNETASGWQEVYFATPVPVSAGTTYIASTYVAAGHFPYTNQYFTTQYTNVPLLALADGAQGGNGVYAYSASNAFPTNSYLATNYWVDVVFASSDTLWTDESTPAVDAHPGTSPVVLGVKFRPTGNGTIRGIRFYKSAFNTGTHIGSLWTTGGQLLASVTYTGETASGWQQAYFNTPVPVTAGTTYIASYNTVSGHFSYTNQYFNGTYTNFPLVAPSDSSSGGNGVYVYSSTNAFPQFTYQATNYWVDLLFDPA
ncbi:MAG: hypothetical protein JWQ95_714 [Sphaerisporangium sp.]|nr:hypothetical protein [Sphaerisporangium sp.]